MNRRPRLLDLFCGAGGASVGYERAGFEVLGVDSADVRASYPSRLLFIKADWRRGAEYRLASERYPIAAIHASPPCQAFSAYRRRGDGVGSAYPDLIAEVRAFLRSTGLPYVIENVPGAPLERPVRLCGSMFGLDVQRHRLFEASFPLLVPPCDHSRWTPRFPAATNREPNSRRTVEIGVWRIPLPIQKRAMGVDWGVTLEELSQAIPPAYTELIGHQLMQHVRQQDSTPLGKARERAG